MLTWDILADSHRITVTHILAVELYCNLDQGTHLKNLSNCESCVYVCILVLDQKTVQPASSTSDPIEVVASV